MRADMARGRTLSCISLPSTEKAESILTATAVSPNYVCEPRLLFDFHPITRLRDVYCNVVLVLFDSHRRRSQLNLDTKPTEMLPKDKLVLVLRNCEWFGLYTTCKISEYATTE